MARKKKLTIDVNNIDSLQELMQEVYHDACTQIKEAQSIVTGISSGVELMDTDDHVKVAKAKTDAMKVKDSAIKTKLDVGKLQNEIIKRKNELTNSPNDGKISEPGEVNLDDFSRLRDMMEKDKKSDNG
jgi:hypothetical protein